MNSLQQTDRFALYDFPLGTYKIVYTDTAITHVELVVFNDKEHAETEKLTSKPTDLSERAKLQLQEYFDGTRHVFDLPLELHGTPFQKKVWSALCDIPYGETRSYKDIACAIGNPKACRAIGMANNKNPVGIVVPCHRVIGANGKLVGYACGLDIKRALLELEKAHR